MEIFSQEWARRPEYRSFWEHYNVAERWRKKHARIVEIAYSQAQPKEEKKATGFQQSADDPAPEDRMSIASPVMKRHCEESVAGPSDVMEVDEDEELSQDYIEFRRITLEHRKKREAKQDEEKNAAGPMQSDCWMRIDNEDFLLVDKVGVFGIEKRTLDAPDEQKKIEQRRAAARELYGEDSEKILAMEAALDMRFNAEYKKRNPPLWPNMPLKF